MQDEVVPAGGRRELVLDRSQRVSRALHDAARKSRLSVRRDGNWSGRARGGRTSSFALVSAIVIFILPTLGAALFYGLLAADIYQSEAQFSVKARTPDATDMLGRMTGLPALQQAQDALVVVEYMHSRALVEKLDAELDLRAMFSRSEVSSFERFDPADPVEKLVRFWRKKIAIGIETSGIINARFRAYRPEDALRITQAVLAASEQLVNEMSLRIRRDAVGNAQKEVEVIEKRLVGLREEVRLVRDRERVIDPRKSADIQTTLISNVRAAKFKIEDEIRVGLRTLLPTAPQMQILQNRLDSVNQRIVELEAEMTGTGNTLARSITSYDKVALEQQAQEKLYAVLAAALEKARMDADRQQVFVEPFVEPVLAQEPEFPRRIWNTFLVGLWTFIGWFALGYVRTAIRG